MAALYGSRESICEAIGRSQACNAQRINDGRMRASAVLLLMITLSLAACGRGEVRPEASDITGVMPPLAFKMARANDGAAVTADTYQGKVVLLYFGYTHCPDACPT